MLMHLAPVGCGELITNCTCVCSHCATAVAQCTCICAQRRHPLHTVCDCSRPAPIRADPDPQPTATRWFSDDYIAYRPYTDPYSRPYSQPYTKPYP